MPAGAQLVTLGDGVGWFIPVEAIPPEYPEASPWDGMMMAGMKRPAGADWGGKGPKKPKGAGKGKDKDSAPAGPVDNPGILEDEQVFTGIIKHVPNSTTGYGFITCEQVAQLYGGKDAFLHLAICPWIEQMNLQIGDIVNFNVELNDKMAPQVKRITKAD
jgi:cold shock CspA family protein